MPEKAIAYPQNSDLVLGNFPKLEESPTTGGRHEIAKHIKKGGVGIELGVAKGHFSNSLLTRSSLRQLFSVDRWSDHHDSKEYIESVIRLSRHGTRSIVMRMDFDEAQAIFPDHHFDFIYIDAYAHEGQQEGKLLDKWWPKLKRGGLFSGHDYHPEWPLTIKAVDQFCERIKREPRIIPGVKTNILEDSYPSWMINK